MAAPTCNGKDAGNDKQVTRELLGVSTTAERTGPATGARVSESTASCRNVLANRPHTVLVTGAAGFVGSWLTDQLLADGHLVIGIDSFTDYYSPALKSANLAAARQHPNFELLVDDLAGTGLDALLDRVDAVFHLAGQPGVRGSWGANFADYLRQNVLITQRLLEALTRQPRPTVVSSTSSVYGQQRGPVSEDSLLRPISPYGMTKQAAEELVALYRREHNLPVVVLRYFTVFGPRQRPDMAFHRFINALHSDQPLHVYGDGEQSRDFTYVADVVRATIAAVGAPSPVYNVGGGTPATVNEVIGLLSELTGRHATVNYEPPARGDAQSTSADTSKASRELGWRPVTGLRQGLVAQLASQDQLTHPTLARV